MKQSDTEIRNLMALCFRAGAFAQFVRNKQYIYPIPQYAALDMAWEEMRALTAMIPNDGIVPEPALLFNEEELPDGDFWITVLEFAYTLLHLRDHDAASEWKQYTKRLIVA